MITRKKTTALSNAVLIAVIALIGAGSAQIKLKRLPGGEETVLAGFQKNDISFVSLSAFCDAEGFAMKWNEKTRKMTCVGGAGKVTFSPDNPFYMVNDSVFQSPCAPLMSNDSLFLPAAVLPMCFKSLEKESIDWSSQDSSILISADAMGKKAQAKAGKTLRKSKAVADDSAGKQQAGSEQIIKTIVIDPGHGGKDPGAISPNGTDEKDIVLSIGLKVRDMLKKKSPFRFS